MANPVKRGSAGGGNSLASLQVTSVSVAQNSLIVVAVGAGLGSTPTITATDSAGNTYTNISQADLATGNTPHAAILVANAATALSSGSVTVAFSPSVNQPAVVVYEAAGYTTTTDGANHATGTSTSPSSGNITTTNANDLVFGACCLPTTAGPYTAGGSFTKLDEISSTGALKDVVATYQVLTGTATIAAAGTMTSNQWAQAVAAVKATAASSPSNTVAPAVTGTAAVGSVLSATNGTWTDNGSPTYTYQWQRDTAGNLSFSNIGSATSSTYTLVDADDGNKVRCVVTDTDTSGASAGTANSNVVGLIVEAGVPTISVAPAVTGTTTVGQTLTSGTGTWLNQGGSVHTYAYQWQRDALGSGSYSNISSATSSTYVLVDADDSCHIKCLVTATNDVGSSSAAASNIVGTVIEPAPTNSVVPALGGTNATAGSAITVTTGTWANMAGAGAHSFTYQWRDCATSGGTYADIASATSSSYTVGAGEATKFLKCVVTAHNTNGSTGSATTVASNQVAAAPAGAAGVPDPSKTASAVVILGL